MSKSTKPMNATGSLAKRATAAIRPPSHRRGDRPDIRHCAGPAGIAMSRQSNAQRPSAAVRPAPRRRRRLKPDDIPRVRDGAVIRDLGKLAAAWRANRYLFQKSVIPKILKVAAAHSTIFSAEYDVERIRRGQFDDSDRWLHRWAAANLPEATKEQIDDALTLRVDEWTPEQIAKYLGVEFYLRQVLRLWSFGACDMTRQERLKQTKADKKIIDRDRAAQRRRQRGAQSRAQYEAESLSRTKPWLALGISERTWYRRGNRRGKPSRPQRLPPAQRGVRARRSLKRAGKNSDRDATHPSPVTIRRHTGSLY